MPNPDISEIVETFWRDIHRYFVRRVGSVDALDLTQDVFVSVWRHYHEGIRDLPARNRLGTYLREECARRQSQREWAEEQLAHIATSSVAADPWLRRAVARVLRELSPARRTAIILHRRDGRTYEEIARRLYVSTNMVKKHQSKGLPHCRERLRHLRETP